MLLRISARIRLLSRSLPDVLNSSSITVKVNGINTVKPHLNKLSIIPKQK